MKVALILSGEQVLFTHTVPDNAKVILVPLDTPVAPVIQEAPTVQAVVKPVIKRPNKTQANWTRQEVKDLLDVAGKEPMGSTRDYEPLVEYFPRHPSAGSIRSKHLRVLGVK